MKFEITVDLNETTLTVEALENWAAKQEFCEMDALIAQDADVITVELYSTFDQLAGFAEAIAELGKIIEETYQN